MPLNREELLARSRPKIEPVGDIEGIGECWVRSMSARHRDAITWDILNLPEGQQNIFNVPNISARVAAYTLCDEAGIYVFRPEDAEVIGDGNVIAYDALAEIAIAGLRASGILPDAVEEAEKNSEGTPTAES